MEVFKDIKGYEGLYQVSNLGNVKSLNRFASDGRFIKGRFLKAKTPNPYKRVSLCKNGMVKDYSVHRLVAETFLDNPYNLPCVNHKDENSCNNRVDNLEWCTYQYNINYGTARQRQKEKLIGVFNTKKSKKVCQYTLDGEFIAEYPSLAEIERQLGFSSSKTSLVCNGKRKTAYSYIWKYKAPE